MTGRNLRTCVAPNGRFVYGLHRPSYEAANRRETEAIADLGHGPDGKAVRNTSNFPAGDLGIREAEWVYEVPNPFPFLGATYILKTPADRLAEDPTRFRLRSSAPADAGSTSFTRELLSGRVLGRGGRPFTLADLPPAVRLALAQTSTEPELLAELARLACPFELGSVGGEPVGLKYAPDRHGLLRPVIDDPKLFEVVANNQALPEPFRRCMVLAPGVQGANPIVGEYTDLEGTHIWEYLRANSYIPYGHYAANMAHDCIRYRVGDLRPADVTGLRHLYYQRILSQLAITLEMGLRGAGRRLSAREIEDLRLAVVEEVRGRMARGEGVPFTATLWGWNFGFDFSPSGYRLHASHQQIHQQFALVPPTVGAADAPAGCLPTYVIGDQVANCIAEYERAYGTAFFDAYLAAIRNNRRLDGRDDLPSGLLLHEQDHVIIHIPKAQRSQGEIQIMTTRDVGNIIEADPVTREALDMAILRVVKILERLGAQMITSYEVSKRIDDPRPGQRLLYCFLPRHPRSPGAFSEWQQRWVTGHYPEDYAEACRAALDGIE